jgi:hypothetical protein
MAIKAAAPTSYFSQSQPGKFHGWILYVVAKTWGGLAAGELRPPVPVLNIPGPPRPGVDGHADEDEISRVMASLWRFARSGRTRFPRVCIYANRTINGTTGLSSAAITEAGRRRFRAGLSHPANWRRSIRLPGSATIHPDGTGALTIGKSRGGWIALTRATPWNVLRFLCLAACYHRSIR